MSVDGISGNGSPWGSYTPQTPSSNLQSHGKLDGASASGSAESSLTPSDVGQSPSTNPQQTVPLGDLFSQISSDPSSSPLPVNNMSPHFTEAVKEIQEAQKKSVLMQAEMQFQMTQAKLFADRMSGIISAQEYEDGVREAQKAFTDKTGEPAPPVMTDPV